MFKNVEEHEYEKDKMPVDSASPEALEGCLSAQLGWKLSGTTSVNHLLCMRFHPPERIPMEACEQLLHSDAILDVQVTCDGIDVMWIKKSEEKGSMRAKKRRNAALFQPRTATPHWKRGAGKSRFRPPVR